MKQWNLCEYILAMLAYDFSVNPTFWCMIVIVKTKNIVFLLLTTKKIAEALGEQQVATVDCISSLQHLKIICLAFFPPFGSDSVCVCVCACMCTCAQTHPLACVSNRLYKS